MKPLKNLGSKKVAFIYDKLHPIHKSLMESINSEFFPFSRNIPKDFDIYIFEASYAKPVFMRKIGMIPKDKKIVSLISDPRLYYLNNGKIFDFKNKKIKKYPLLRSLIMKYLIKGLDGAFCLCELNFELFKKFNPKAPAYRFTGFVSSKVFKQLQNLSPRLNNKNILFLGYGPDYYCKGLDLLIDSFKIVKKKMPDAKLYISGDWDIKKEWKSEGVIFLGIVENILEFMKMASLGVHMGRGEAFGANIPEMMLAGIPVITSEFTGAKEVVKKVDSSLIIDLDENILAKRIIQYFKLPLKDKEKVSEKAKRIAKEYSEKKIVKKFRKDAQKFLKKL